ncbi:putative copper-transporting ATPase HMA5 [Platanthera zijinensis]|uniref:Copper-transporting ATPase HMA5 n=1 Tax=Platanthera zijinensis TaxID=2320716 RepID=A0AAP0C1X4_9ASPA
MGKIDSYSIYTPSCNLSDSSLNHNWRGQYIFIMSETFCTCNNIVCPVKAFDLPKVDERVTKSVAAGNKAAHTARFIAANIEHPLAKAIVEHAKKFKEEEEYVAWAKARDFISITGHNVKAIIGNKELVVGNKSLMLATDIQIPNQAMDLLLEAEEIAQTGILVAINSEILGLIVISDPLKPVAKEVISILKSMNVRSIMVTRDNWGTTKAIACEIGINTIVAEAKPEEKAEKMSRLTVAMVGDGINESPTLVSADAGMAIGVGTDVAIEAADIVLMKSNLEDVITAIMVE